MARPRNELPKRRKDAPSADYAEAIQILSEMARGGDVRAAIALAGHLRKEREHEHTGEEESIVDELAERRAVGAD